ncbi:DUF1203 domain-containing protein [Rhizobium sp. KVB221]|uniref:DUF1203 domain-containing protein n=1 Tax=Rhizobium setariae TaxID=2801340 RepID=A0A936YM14_9HYPH|nr:DUF1203 domain-containing protein [Rhizobium setariae]MBL0372853.1 DUF1203 domain-containing protein [Rhizobium setariae]
MPDILFQAMPTEDAEAIWAGGTDAYGLPPETMTSKGAGYPCRHCLQNIDDDDELLVFAYRPFPDLQPYAETGPVFLHKSRCERYRATEVPPPILRTSKDYILRGYNDANRIVYGTGSVILSGDVSTYAQGLLVRDDIAYIHVRSARNNCYQCRIDRA